MLSGSHCGPRDGNNKKANGEFAAPSRFAIGSSNMLDVAHRVARFFKKELLMTDAFICDFCAHADRALRGRLVAAACR